MIVRKREDPGKCNRKHQIVLCGELAIEEALNLSQDRTKLMNPITNRHNSQRIYINASITPINYDYESNQQDATM
jgi:hypothetical protein